jgi:3-hydroxybutyryl-CoA dehydratase
MPDSLAFDELRVGDTASVGKTVTEADILLYTAVSTDTNPVHLDEEAAARSHFGHRVAHGMLSAGLISAVLGTKLPGEGTVYVSQSLHFRHPVRIGDTVTATVTVTGLEEHHQRVRLNTVCTVGGRTVIEGEAVVMPPRRD